MNDIDLSNEALLKHRAIAEKATPSFIQEGLSIYGPLHPDSKHPNGRIFVAKVAEGSNKRDPHLFGGAGAGSGVADAAHIAANSPDVVKAHVDEILRLRNLVQEHEEYIANLELEAASTNNKINGLAVLLGIPPDTGNRRIIGIIKNEILRLRAEVERLEREAEWLANHCREFCKSYSYCGECPMFRGWLSCVYEDCGETVGYRGEQHTANWREAARKAVEEDVPHA